MIAPVALPVGVVTALIEAPRAIYLFVTLSSCVLNHEHRRSSLADAYQCGERIAIWDMGCRGNNSPFSFPNPNLKPEESIAYEVGIEQEFWQQRLRFKVTLFG
jgi:hypothetical protein